jgi:hypothetical protein
MTPGPPKLRAIFEFLVVAACTMTFALTAMGIVASFFGRDAAGTRDFVEYWAAGHQLIRHLNPYDFQEILKLEHSTGFPPGIAPQMFPNPPSALLLLLPLGALSPVGAEVLWLLLLIASLVASVQLLRAIHPGQAKNPLHLLAYAFAPVLSCLLAGQISLFILLGLVLFLRFHRTRPVLAGAALWLCLLKPHLFLPFGLVLLLWIFITRSYKILLGAAISLAIGSGFATIMDPLVWKQYSQMMSAARVDRTQLPCLSAMLRLHVYPHTFWLQCLPAGLACLWAIAYFLKRRDSWDWTTHGSILMLVSVTVAPYSWFMDQSVLIPALLYGAYVTRSRTLIAILALLSAALEFATFHGVGQASTIYAWTAPAWLMWYLFASRNRSAAGQANLSPKLSLDPEPAL